MMPMTRGGPGRIRDRLGLAAALATPFMMALAAGSALAQPDTAAANPPEMAVVRPNQRTDGAGPAVQRRDGLLVRPAPTAREAFVSLTAKYTSTTLYNPATGTNDAVKLRTYNDSLAGPTVRVFPGETVRIDLNNDLPLEDCVLPQGNHNVPSCFNTTNLHAHGLWVSPAGNSDNVLLEVQPRTSFQYEYNIPADHPAGTFWYHPHRHGSTAIQVGSGMAGALIVMGNRPPQGSQTGDIDTILKYAPDRPFNERLFVMEQIPYACFNADGTIEKDDKGRWVCKDGEVGEVKNYTQFGPGLWGPSGRPTLVNGLVQPIVSEIAAGQVERWRFLHAGVREAIAVEVRKMKASPAPIQTFSGDELDAWAKETCSGPSVALWSIARDGLTLERVTKEKVVIHEPGYRTDALIAFPEDGDYCVLDSALENTATINAQDKKNTLLAFVQVRGGKPFQGDGEDVIRAALLDGVKTLPAESAPATVAEQVTALSLASFIPHPTITKHEVTGRQDLVFGIDVSSGSARFGVNHQSFQPGRIDRELTLGGVDEWVMTSSPVAGAPVGHPFHIHINPFQIVRILNPDGVDVTDPAVALTPEQQVTEADYRLLKGVWKDTLFIKANYRVEVRTRYRRYIGDYVLHCHILDHEDQGMMQNVRVSLPGSSLSAHGH